ncbi:hypothetical protein ACS0TY_025024 [Phlomoides rotata]
MMSASKPTNATFYFFLIFICMTTFKFSYSMRNNGIILCPEIEKDSLLSFKKSLEDPQNQLSSWDGEVDCCKWEGVVCNNLTGHVHQLHLGSNWSVPQGLSGKINPSLLNLKHLRHLDLSGNNFSGETIPSFIGSLTNLEFLNLAAAGFYGKIPHNIGNLSSLRTLHLESNPLEGDSLEWLPGLSKLEYLNMNDLDLSKATNWAQVINSLPSLLQLHFSSCELDFVAHSINANNTSITHLDLSSNSCGRSSALPRWIFQLRNLVYLDLSYCCLAGPIPTISNATKLQHINLFVNDFNSSIPDWLYFNRELEFVSFGFNSYLHGTISNAIKNLTSLSSLDLSWNKLSGRIPKEISKLCRIRDLDLSGNELQGEISDSFGDMSECFLGSLESLVVQSNNLSGHLTSQFGEFKNLRTLDLSNNSLSGVLPVSIGKLSSLEELYIQDNKLGGVVTESHFSNLTKLVTLSASKNHLTLNVSSDWSPPFQLINLEIRSWDLGVGSKIPSWLEKQKYIENLDLYGTGITGTVPDSFWKIQNLDLSDNHLTGKIPEQVHCEYLYLSSNKFSGSVPRITGGMKELDLFNNSFSGGISHFLCDTTYETFGLLFLNLGENQLSGELPDCWQKIPNLGYLNIGNNNISGSIPNSVQFLAYLWSLNLGGNKITGQVSSSMRNCTKLVKIDLADNDLDGSIPAWMGTSLFDLQVLILRSNRLSNEIPTEICNLNSLQILDLADNQFFGRIPRCVYNFTAMATKRSQINNIFTDHLDGTFHWDFSESATVATKGTRMQYNTILSLVTNIDLSRNNLSGGIPTELTSLVELKSLNLSANNFRGVIPNNIGNMKQLESLDFSRNSLSGQIPNGFTLLSSLAYLNLSCNNLTGKIPESTQLLGFNASSFTGNNLCGPPLTSHCSDEVHEHEDEKEDDESKIEWFYVVLSLGYAVGFSAVCTALVLNKSWREAYFGLLESTWDKLYVYVYIRWRRLTTKPSGASS